MAHVTYNYKLLIYFLPDYNSHCSAISYTENELTFGYKESDRSLGIARLIIKIGVL